MSVEFPALEALKKAQNALMMIEDLREIERGVIARKELKRRTSGLYGWFYQWLFGPQTLESVHRQLIRSQGFSDYKAQSLLYRAQEIIIEGIEAAAESAHMRNQPVRLTTNEVLTLSRWVRVFNAGDKVLTPYAGVAQRKGQ